MDVVVAVAGVEATFTVDEADVEKRFCLDVDRDEAVVGVDVADAVDVGVGPG